MFAKGVGLLIRISGIAVAVSACPDQAVSHTPNLSADLHRGSELQLCDDCPPFVRVPNAPSPLRPIRYVAKFELTWNNYLAAYDDGACGIPNPNTEPQLAAPNDILPHLDKYRIDWPIVILGVPEVQCYIAWLQRKTPLKVSLPTSEEWEWFARAGRNDAKFPWGDQPDATREALGRTAVAPRSHRPWSFEDGGRDIDRHLSGVKVGLFPPNDWGLHDIMGNVRELTADTIPGDARVWEKPKRETVPLPGNKPRAVLKGSNWWVDPNWSSKGIDREQYAIIFGDRFSARVGIRLVLI